jgi:hypothetical protein
MAIDRVAPFRNLEPYRVEVSHSVRERHQPALVLAHTYHPRTR